MLQNEKWDAFVTKTLSRPLKRSPLITAVDHFILSVGCYLFNKHLYINNKLYSLSVHRVTMRGIGDPLIQAECFHIINLFFIWKSNVPLNCLLSLNWWHTGGTSVEKVFCEVSSSLIKVFRYFGFQNDIYCYLTTLVERIVDRHVTYYSRNDKQARS